MYYALLEHRRYLFGLIKRYNVVGFFDSSEAAVSFADNCMGFAAHAYTIQPVTAAQKTAMTLNMIGD